MSDTKALEDCNFDEPWPLYADRDEPWKDFDLLSTLNEQMDYQYEIADALGTTPSTISYWIGKMESEYESDPSPEEVRCDYYEVCHNSTAGVPNEMCGLCIDLVRRADAEGFDPDADGKLDYMRALHEHFTDYVATYEDRQADDDEEDDDGVCNECDEELVEIETVSKQVCPSCGTAA